jgi:hypothetical protein
VTVESIIRDAFLAYCPEGGDGCKTAADDLFAALADAGYVIVPNLHAQRRSCLSAAGMLAPDLPIGAKSIGFYDRVTKTWSDPA